MTGNIAVRERTNSAERRANVMGTDAHVIVVGAEAARLADLALARLERLESRWSRFLPQSEISRLNERPGVPVVVAPETFQLIDHALRAWRMTAGRFDPTILADLRAEGYDRSYELLDRPEPSAAEVERGAHPATHVRRSPRAGHPSRPRRRKRDDSDRPPPSIPAGSARDSRPTLLSRSWCRAARAECS